MRSLKIIFCYSAAIHDTTREKQNTLSGNIAAYNNLIIEESRKTSPDSTRISLWKDAVFDMNREKEKITDKINREFPQYSRSHSENRTCPAGRNTKTPSP